MSEAVYRDQEYLPALGVEDILRTGSAMLSGVKDEHLHQDALSEYVVGALEALQKAEAGRPVRALQYAYGRGRALSFLSRERRHRDRERATLQKIVFVAEDGRPTEAVEIEQDHSSPDPEAITEKADVEAAVRAAVEALPEPLQQVIGLRHFSGMAWQQVATALQLSKQGAMMRHERAMAALRKTLEKAGLRPLGE